MGLSLRSNVLSMYRCFSAIQDGQSQIFNLGYLLLLGRPSVHVMSCSVARLLHYGAIYGTMYGATCGASVFLS